LIERQFGTGHQLYNIQSSGNEKETGLAIIEEKMVEKIHLIHGGQCIKKR
jgi:hypothetical protein